MSVAAEIAELVGWEYWNGDNPMRPNGSPYFWSPDTDLNHLFQALEMRWPDESWDLSREFHSGRVGWSFELMGEEFGIGVGGTVFAAGLAALRNAGPMGESDAD